MTIGLLISWRLQRFEKSYYMTYTDYSYLNCISSKFNKVILITPTQHIIQQPIDRYAITQNNVSVIEIPFFSRHLEGLKYFKSYYKALKSCATEVDVFYCRMPDHFIWMPTLFFKKKAIINFVGDSINATYNNTRYSLIKKIVLITGYFPDYILGIIACKNKRTKVYAQGNHFIPRLKPFGINPTQIISSTLTESDFYTAPSSRATPTKLLYVGYLKYHKGVMDTISLFKYLRNDAHLTIVGSGEHLNQLLDEVVKLRLEDKVTFVGHIDSREGLLSYYRSSDIFLFPSLGGEGSPRVVLEAMANRLPTVATKVGSLPYVFKDDETIYFVPYNSPKEVAAKVDYIIDNPRKAETLAKKAQEIVSSNYTVKFFIDSLFSSIR